MAIVLLAVAFVVFDRLSAGYGLDPAWFAQNNHNLRFSETASYAAAMEVTGMQKQSQSPMDMTGSAQSQYGQ